MTDKDSYIPVADGNHTSSFQARLGHPLDTAAKGGMHVFQPKRRKNGERYKRMH